MAIDIVIYSYFQDELGGEENYKDKSGDSKCKINNDDKDINKSGGDSKANKDGNKKSSNKKYDYNDQLESRILNFIIRYFGAPPLINGPSVIMPVNIWFLTVGRGIDKKLFMKL